jgi:NAD-dependent dihydropyrimidine dehydrogenase PreA subunit
MPDKDQLSYRQIMVGCFPAGLTGLDEIFESLYNMNQEPADQLGPELVDHARQHNYIPASVEADYAAALLREYGSYYEERRSGQKTTARRETWRGIPREQIPWFPMLDEMLCDGCDKCLQFCSSRVYTKGESGTVYVAQPMNCVVGCDACARLCPHGAIRFPPRAMLNTLTCQSR